MSLIRVYVVCPFADVTGHVPGGKSLDPRAVIPHEIDLWLRTRVHAHDKVFPVPIRVANLLGRVHAHAWRPLTLGQPTHEMRL